MNAFDAAEKTVAPMRWRRSWKSCSRPEQEPEQDRDLDSGDVPACDRHGLTGRVARVWRDYPPGANLSAGRAHASAAPAQETLDTGRVLG